jgi:hypothetical protein
MGDALSSLRANEVVRLRPRCEGTIVGGVLEQECNAVFEDRTG